MLALQPVCLVVVYGFGSCMDAYECMWCCDVQHACILNVTKATMHVLHNSLHVDLPIRLGFACKFLIFSKHRLWHVQG